MKFIRLLLAATIAFPLFPAPARAEDNAVLLQREKERLIYFKPVPRREIDLDLEDDELLLRIAKDTWSYMYNVVDRDTGLLLDNVIVTPTFTKVNSYTSTTNIGLYLMSMVAGTDFRFIGRDVAIARIRKVLESLHRMERWNGHFFNYYKTGSLKASGRFASSVDNGWLTAGLMVARQAFPQELSAELDPLIKQLNFRRLYDPTAGQLLMGYDADRKALSETRYGLLCTEPRVASYVGIAKGDLPSSHWYSLYRTLPKDWAWQQQEPQGDWKIWASTSYFNGYYTHNRRKFVPSWGGSLFEFLMPTLVVDEQGLAPKGLGLNNKVVVDAHIDYALKNKGYPVWGISPCSIPNITEGYREYGVKYLGSKGYEDEGVITPHVSFLALDVSPDKAIKNIRNLLAFRGIYGEYGFYDSVDVNSGVVSPRFLALDQGMTFLALANHLQDGAIRRRFMSYPGMEKIPPLLAEEFY